MGRNQIRYRLLSTATDLLTRLHRCNLSSAIVSQLFVDEPIMRGCMYTSAADE